ncbi:MAG TPA: MG2 domain-containing protein [Bryobacteraceae bacterium]
MKRLRKTLRLLLLLGVAAAALSQRETRPFFNLSTSRTFGSNEKPTVMTSAFAISALQFRVYRVNDPVLFFRQLEDPHTFGDFVPAEARHKSLIERFHRWKTELRADIRRSLRAQFTDSPSGHLARMFSSSPQPQATAEKGTHYAETPVLNPDQLVLTFVQPMQGKEFQQQTVDVPVKERGVYLVEAVNGKLRAYTLLIVSDAVMVSKTGGGKLVNLVVDRNTGQPLAHVHVTAMTRDKTLEETETNDDGIAEFHSAPPGVDDIRVVARNGRDIAANMLGGSGFGGESDQWTGYIYTDRPIYRPGHTVHFKGILRLRTSNGYEVPAGKRVKVEIEDPDEKPVYQQSLTVSSNGTIRDDLTLAANAALGNYYVQVTYGEDRMTGNFEVEEYKKPEYEVHVTPITSRVLEGEQIRATINAQYYFGEPVAGGKVKYDIYRSRYWSPLLYDADDEDLDSSAQPGNNDDDGGDQILEQEGQLDADGKLVVNIPTTVSDRKFDYAYRIEARVTDSANREIDGTGWAIATYGSFFVKVTPQRYFYNPGAKASFTIQARDYNNQPVRSHVHVELLRWNFREPDQSQLKSSADAELNAEGNAEVTMDIPAQGGSFQVQATARGSNGREPEGSSSVWVSGGNWDFESVENPTVPIVTEKKTYVAGETAKLLIAAGQPNTAVYVTIEGRNVREYKVLRSQDSTVSFELPLRVQDEPGVAVSAAFVRDGVFHNGSKFVKVPPVQHQMKVSLKADKPQYQPGQSAEYSIEATGVDGKPVPGAEFSLGVVDEAIYGIQPDSTPAILDFFFARDFNRVFTDNSLQYYFTGEAGTRRMQLAGLRAPSHLAQLKPDRLVLPKIRKAFPDTAFWDADLTTDNSGIAHAKVEFPDSLTTWRATVRGVTPDTKVGSAVLKTIVRKNLILRLAVPRFFVQGDEMVISALVHNYLSDAKTARVSLDVKGLDILDGGTKDVQIASRGEAKVDWRVRVQQVRTATITGKALTNEESDGLEMELPVNVPGVKLTGAHGGAITPGGNAAFDMSFPAPGVTAKVQPGSRSLSLQVSPSIAGSLFGALDFLTTFPYGCVEQTMSSFLPDIIVEGTVRELGLNANIDEPALQEKIRDGLERLYAFQHKDGGWGWWETDDSHPFMTAYVVAGLAQAGASGVKVRPDLLDFGVKWLLQDLAANPQRDPDLRAYFAYALALAGKADANVMNSAYGARGSMSSYGLALLGLALDQLHDNRAAEIAAAVEGRAQQDPEQAWWPSERDPMLDFSADTTPEATAFATRLLARQGRGATLLPKAALWLMNHRNEGYWWSSTKQTAMVIYGLTDYLRTANELKPNLTATVYVNNKAVLTRNIDQATGLNPPDVKLEDSQLDPGVNHIRVEVSGTGRLYYSVRSEYYSAEAKLQKTGGVSLNLLRDYYRLTPSRNGEKIVYDTVPLNGPVQTGDILAVRLTVTGSEWKYLLIEDPIPSGAEFIERDNLYEIRNRPPWWRYFFTRRELHDDRMAIFQTYFLKGQQQYFYLLKVVNAGIFQVSPARVGPMYQPEVSATSESRKLEVK